MLLLYILYLVNLNRTLHRQSIKQQLLQGIEFETRHGCTNKQGKTQRFDQFLVCRHPVWHDPLHAALHRLQRLLTFCSRAALTRSLRWCAA